jgi:mono/diheme cytochrome c family protein
MMRHAIWLLLAIVSVSAGCRGTRTGNYAAKWDRSALDQQWTQATSEHYWWTSQGSQVMPYAYFTALELKDSQELFASSAHFDRLRYITVPAKSDRNPGGLAIGFVKNEVKADGLDVVGFTCAACHTAKWQINGTDVLVEGGPTKGDAQTFLYEIIDSATQTIEQQDKLDRFAKRVGTDAATVKVGLTAWRDRLVARRVRNPIPADNEPGFGRIDALTNIVNEIAAGDLGVPENVRTANAPVSVPHVWDAPQHDVVQWNGSIPNAGAGPALRNIGEVLGTFGTIEIEPKPGRLPRYPNTTAETKNLNAIEQDLWALASPRWPEALVPIDQALAAAGKPLYEQQCGSCHLPIDRTNQARRIVAQMKDVGTDQTLNRSLSRPVKTGKLEGTPKMLNPYTVFQKEDSPIDVLLNAVFGAYLAHKDDFNVVPRIALTGASKTGRLPSLGLLSESLDGDVKQAIADFHATATQITQAYKLTGNTQPPETNNYKARPLNGIWATGPFLHNGSVPTLAELLTTDSKRVKEFYVGSWLLDTKNVGITSLPQENGVKLYLFKTNLEGNSNAGHNYGTDLTAEQKRQLIEFLKTL